MKSLFFNLLILSVTIISCSYGSGKRMRGNGVIKTENRTAVTFNNIDVSGNVDVYVKQDSVASLKIEADENLLQYIVTDIDGNTLQIHSRKGINLQPTRSIKVFVSGASFQNFDASGACAFYSENKITSNVPIRISLSGAGNVKMELKAPLVKADLSGVGTITLKGETKAFEIDGSGSCEINCFELLSENTKVDISGAGDAEVFASVKLDVSISGAAAVKYKGNASLSKSVSGAGSVKKVE